MKNEELVPKEDLEGRYRRHYMELLNNLSNQQKTAVKYCKEVFRFASEYLERGTYTYDWDRIAESYREYYEMMGKDPFAGKILLAVYEVLEERDGLLESETMKMEAEKTDDKTDAEG